MKAGRVITWALVLVLLAAVAVLALLVVPGWLAQGGERPSPIEAAAPAPTRHIKATLFYVSEDGLRLVPVEREVVFGEGVVEQARRLVEAQLQPAPAPLLSAIPGGTAVRALYVSERGEAFVDFSPEISTAHPGGALNELLTVYAIVNVLTTNLPALAGVQILVNGREVDTLAGHVDLRRPLPRSALMIQEPQPAGTTASGAEQAPAPAPALPATAPGTPPTPPAKASTIR